MEEKEEYYTTNNVSKMIKTLAVIIAIIEIIGSFVLGANTDEFIFTVIGLIGSILSGLSIYSFGELIEIMHDIRTNTEHLRDNKKN